MNLMIKIFLSSALIILTTMSRANVVLKDTKGNNISFSALKGKWVLINYWASWCATCIEEIPDLNRFYRKYQGDKVALFAVHYDTLPLYKQNKLIKKFKIQYPSLLKNPAFALGLEDIPGIPVTFVFNPQGQLVNTLYGGQDMKSLEKAITDENALN